MPSIQNEALPTIQIALSDLYGRANSMVRRLSVSQVSATTSLQETRGFQLAWNQYLGEINAWLGSLGFRAEGISEEILTVGLKDDGKYGNRTAHGLAVLLLAAGLEPSIISNMPTSPQRMPLWFAQYQSQINGVFLGMQAGPIAPAPTNVPVDDTQQTADEIIDTARDTQEVLEQNETVDVMRVSPEDMGSEHDFEEGSNITSTAGRTAWDVPLWAIGLGVVTVGGIVFAISRRARRSARVAV